jgi:hypothetical protein
MEDAPLGYGPGHGQQRLGQPPPLLERHLRAKNLSDGTVASYLVDVRQSTAFLQPHGRELTRPPARTWRPSSPTCSPLVASNGVHPLQAATGAVPLAGGRGGDRGQPMARMTPPVVPDKPIPVLPEDGQLS